MPTETAIQIQVRRHYQTLVDTSRQVVTWTAFAILAMFKSASIGAQNLLAKGLKTCKHRGSKSASRGTQNLLAKGLKPCKHRGSNSASKGAQNLLAKGLKTYKHRGSKSASIGAQNVQAQGLKTCKQRGRLVINSHLNIPQSETDTLSGDFYKTESVRFLKGGRCCSSTGWT